MTVYSPAPGGIGILGTGSYLPERVVTNETVAARAGVTAEWVERKTGIRERRYAADHEAASDLATEAAVRALADAGARPEDLAWIVVATSTPDHPQPATAAFVQHRLGASGAAAFDVNAVCAGFIAALHTGSRLLAGPEADGRRRLALVIGSEVYSRIIDPEDRRTAPLFGDGAGAVVLGPVAGGRGLLGTGMRTDGHLHGLIGVAAGGSRQPASEKTVARGDHFFRMRGRDVRAFVERELPDAVAGTLDAFGVRADAVDHFVPHQANGEMLRSVAAGLGLVSARVHLPVERHGNTGAASIPLALDEARRAGEPSDGDLVLLAGFGGGMTVGTALLRWGR
ncbi:3-oxoacyl-[acyl-carrier-protein] synthase-3 [Streptomyces sp. 840.1]|uniref:3-oxoacyl-ACP synthase III family protein n=1 Tax=Streptomyces sp. 840.1 TaxID=2485152 RepID=UPI000F485825|nr:beta-ketoacyl-ACP synthase III [Streptomyces sp. 840.1]ROQ57457.1 3-oxoacyl-[acyl-carrier-protein] synthase-3 [Streptomyces sp. 840.1]